MIVPAGFEDMNEEQLIVALVKQGYEKGAAAYLAGKIKGTVEDDNVIQ